MEATQQCKALLSHSHLIHVWFSRLIKFPFAFHLWEQAENPADKNSIMHYKIFQILNKKSKPNVIANEWMNLVSAVTPLLHSECDPSRSPSVPLLFGSSEKDGKMGTQWTKCAPVVGSGLRPAWFSYRESKAGADAVNCLGLIWVSTSSARILLFPSCGHTPYQHRGLSRLFMLVNVSV